MNEVIQNIVTRRSIRSFKMERIKRADLEQILQAAACAPSGMNRQTWQFTAITNQEKIKELAALIEKKLQRPNYNFYKPAAIVLTSNERSSKWGREDNACAMENMFLAAHALGIGSVWINQLQDITDDEEVRSFLKEVGIPSEHVVYGVAALGYADGEPREKVLKEGTIKIIE